MAFNGFTLPDLSGNKLESKKERQQILEYLYQLGEQLRYTLGNLDQNNLSRGLSQTIASTEQTATTAETSLKQLDTLVSNKASKASVQALERDKLDKTSVYNGLDKREEGYALDARQAAALLLAAYPVGAIYLSVSDVSPATLFGGAWVRIQDVFLLAAGASYAADATGGEAEHTLTVNELPAHDHNVLGVAATYQAATYEPQTDAELAVGGALGTGQTGGGAAHNNMPPYLAVYAWKRTA